MLVSSTPSLTPRPIPITSGSPYTHGMCGRFNLRLSPAELQEFFDLFREVPAFPPRYNIAPTQTVLSIRQTADGRECVAGPWGIRPKWKPTQPLINARSETVFETRAFRKSVRERRCLVPASGFYEWQTLGRKKQPWHIWLASEQPIAFAGFQDSEGAVCMMTTAPNAEMSQIHDRMPVILPPAVWDHYLNPSLTDPAEIAPLLVPLPDESLILQAVGLTVSNARNETPDCIKPAPAGLFSADDATP